MKAMPAPPQEETAMKEKLIKYDLFQLTHFLILIFT